MTFQNKFNILRILLKKDNWNVNYRKISQKTNINYAVTKKIVDNIRHKISHKIYVVGINEPKHKIPLNEFKYPKLINELLDETNYKPNFLRLRHKYNLPASTVCDIYKDIKPNLIHKFKVIK